MAPSKRHATRRAAGATSRRYSSCLRKTSRPFWKLRPLRLRPGRANDSIRPCSTGKGTWTNRIGTVRVARAAASVAEAPTVISKSGPLRSNASARPGRRSARKSANRRSITRSRPRPNPGVSAPWENRVAGRACSVPGRPSRKGHRSFGSCLLDAAATMPAAAHRPDPVWPMRSGFDVDAFDHPIGRHGPAQDSPDHGLSITAGHSRRI